MKLKYLDLTNFRCFEALEFEFDKQLTVIVAQNGSGKTSILDAIATGFGPLLTRLPGISGKNFEKTDLRILEDKRSPYLRVSIILHNKVAWDRTEKRDQASKTVQQIPLALGIKSINDYVDKQIIDPFNEEQPFTMPLIIYYGTGRGVFDTPKNKSNFQKDFSRFDALTGALEGKAKFHRLFQWFDAMENMERREQQKRKSFDFRLPELQAVRQAIELMMPGFENPRIEMRPWRFIIDWEKDQEKQSYRIEQLSDGYRTTLAMVMDIAGRMAQANPDDKNPLLAEAIVIIDEVDLHLHPAWQQTILIDLQRTFPNVQFIVSTHSPQVISTVPAKQIRILGSNDVYSSEPGTKGAESSRILKRVFGVEPRPQDDPNTKLLYQYLDLVYKDDWDTPEAKQNRKQLDDIYQGNEPALTEVDLYIENRKWELEDEKG